MSDMDPEHLTFEATKAKCPECERAFNLLDDVDAEEWYYGHDCEG